MWITKKTELKVWRVKIAIVEFAGFHGLKGKSISINNIDLV